MSAKNFSGVLVYGAPALCQRHLVEVGRELRERELAGAELLLEADDLVPRLELERRSHRARLERQATSRSSIRRRSVASMKPGFFK